MHDRCRQNTLREQRDIPVYDPVDVLVAGGGVAGVAAAVAAARAGKRVLLLEKMTLLGGLATAGLVVIYLPLCDGRGRRLISGISEEMLWASIEHGYDNLPDIWRGRPQQAAGTQRYRTVFNGPLFAMQLDRLLTSSGARVLLDTRVCAVMREGARVTHVIVENADGRGAIPCGAVVDATGDAVIFSRMGARTVDGPNYVSCWAYETSLERVRAAAHSGRVEDAIGLYTGGADCNGKRQPHGVSVLTGVSAAQTTQMAMWSRREAFAHLTGQPRGSMAFTALPGMPQFRTTRRIAGDSALDFAARGRRCDTSIGCCGDWRSAGAAFEIPYGALTSPDAANVLAAGRIIACADREAWEVARVIPVAAQTGEAAGIAAALAAGGDVHQVEARAVASQMAQRGHVIHL